MLQLRKIFLLTFWGILSCAVVNAETLKLEDEMRGEHLPKNQVWAKIKLKSGIETCGLWQTYCPQGGCESCVVDYLLDEQRDATKLVWSEKYKKWLDRRGMPYDTRQAYRDLAKKYAKEKYNPLSVPKTLCDVAAEKRWGIRPGIWVVDTAKNLYTSVEQAPGRFHHSSFMAGGLVRSAGQIVFVDGEIRHISNSSGHYKPDRRSMKKVIKDLHIDESIVEYDDSSTSRRSINNMRESAPSLHASLADNRRDDKHEEDRVEDRRNPDCYDLYEVDKNSYDLYRSQEHLSPK